MKPTRAEFLLSTGYTALFALRVVHEDVEHDGPFLLLPVTDYDDAADVLDTLERSAARKRAEKTKQPAPAAATPAPPTGVAGAGKEDLTPPPASPQCEAPQCPVEGRLKFNSGGVFAHFCEPHFTTSTPAQLREWHEAFTRSLVTPPGVGKKRAKELGEKFAGKTDAGSAPGPKAA